MPSRQCASFWYNDITGSTCNGTLPEYMDIIVVGGGLSGSSMVYWLAELYGEHLPSVLLLEKKWLAGGATGRNGGHLRPVNDQETLCAQDMVNVIKQHNLEEEVELFVTNEHPLEAQVHPAKLVNAFTKLAMRNKNVSVLTGCGVTGFSGSRDCRVVHTEKGDVRCKIVIVCTNGFTSEIIPELKGIVIPVRGQCIATESLDVEKLIFPSNSRYPSDEDSSVYIIQRRNDGRIIAGGYRNTVPGEEKNQSNDDEINDEIGMRLRKWLREDPRIVENSSGREIKVEYDWTGIMGFTMDSTPVVGELSSNLFVSIGFNGHGMPVCFWAAKSIVAKLYGIHESVLQPYSSYSPKRFQNNRITSKL